MDTPPTRKRQAQPDPQTRAAIGQVKRARTRTRILSATLELYGREGGLFTRIEEICETAEITRQTFYNHFTSMDELRDTLTYEVTHDFLIEVTTAIEILADPARRAAAAIRFYIDKARKDPAWGWAMVHISARGIIFGMETYLQAERTVADGIASGDFLITDSRLGRDLILGTSLAAIVTQLHNSPAPGFTAAITRQILVGLGVAPLQADRIVAMPLPSL